MKSAHSPLIRRGLACFLVLGALLLSSGCQQAGRSSVVSNEGPSPIAALLHTSVWDLGIQPTPRVVVYENGHVILSARSGDADLAVWRHYTFQLTTAELEALRRQVHELAALQPKPFYEALPDNWMVRDDAHSKIYVRDGSREAAISVYALEFMLREGQGQLRPYESGGPPPQFISLYQRLGNLAKTPPPLARVWTPNQMEVRLRDDSKHLNSRSVEWPKNWPVPGSPNTQARGDHVWQVLVDGPELTRLNQTLGVDTEKAVSIKGKTWAACWRPVLPREAEWWSVIKTACR